MPQRRWYTMDLDERPDVHCFVALPLADGEFTAPALVSLGLAAELKEKGYSIVGPDPHDMAVLEEWIVARQWLKRLG